MRKRIRWWLLAAVCGILGGSAASLWAIRGAASSAAQAQGPGARAPVSIADLVGRYHEGDGLCGAILDLSTDGTFSFHTYTDEYVGPPVPLPGTYSLEDGVAVLHYKDPPKKPDPWGQPDRLIAVRWGQRMYLITEQRMIDFCNGVNRGFEPRDDPYGMFLLREGDEAKPAPGQPEVPPKYGDYLITAPILGEVTSVGEDGKFTLNVGRTHGARVGMELSRPGSLSELVVRSVDERTCVTERGAPEWDDEPIIVGDLFVVGAVAKLSPEEQARLKGQGERPAVKPPKAVAPLTGSRIAYASGIMYGSGETMCVMRADGSGAAELTGGWIGGDYVSFCTHPSWSPDGTQIAFSASGVGGSMGSDLAIVKADGSGLRRLTNVERRMFIEKTDKGVTMSSASCDWPSWSPDGTRIVYSSDSSIGDEVARCHQIYVIGVERGDERRLTDA